MKKKIFISIGIFLSIVLLVTGYLVLDSISHIGSPTGERGPNYPYFITTVPTTVKKITVPKGTKLTYEEHFFKEGEQFKIMEEEKLNDIELPVGKTIDWGGVPVYKIIKFGNPAMQGFTVCPDFAKLKNGKENKFSKMWQKSSCDLGVLIKNTNEWSFNVKNIIGISDCDFKNKQFRHELFNELKKVN